MGFSFPSLHLETKELYPCTVPLLDFSPLQLTQYEHSKLNPSSHKTKNLFYYNIKLLQYLTFKILNRCK
jgi:hypothetical protein